MVPDARWPAGAYIAEFPDVDALARAVQAFRDKGYTRLETYSPVPLPRTTLHGRSRLPVAVFVAGLIGGALSYAIQWYANAYSYPLNIGGRPAHAIPAFIVATFEGTILVAAVATFIGFFWIVRLPELWHLIFEVDGSERTTVDRYWLAIDAADARSTPEQTVQELSALSPLRILQLAERS